MNHHAALQREHAVGQCQHQIEIVFDDDNRNVLTQSVKHVEQFKHDSRRQSFERFVQKEKFGVAR